MNSFEQLDLLAPLQRSLKEEGYTTPTPIQAATLPEALEGRDILGCARTGTGKTAAFALPILNYLAEEQIPAEPGKPAALILSPTRELAIQIGESLSTYGRHLKIRHALIYGGVSQHSQTRALQKGVQIVVATPGRLLDLIGQGHLSLEHLDIFVLDEVDRMLGMGFLPDLKRIIAMLPEERQSMFFSATLAPEIVRLAERLLFDPLSVNVAPETRDLSAITQRVLHLSESQKAAVLQKVIQGPDVEQVIVFTRTKRRANVVCRKLAQSGAAAAVIHGNKSQNARQRALTGFRNGDVRVLVATDVAARGIDVDGITHVVNYDLPVEPEAYVHRIGRTGRAGATGTAMSFCSREQRDDLRAIERLVRHVIDVDPDFPAGRNDAADDPGPRRDSSGGGNRRGSRPSGRKRSRTASQSGRNERSGTPADASQSSRQQRTRRPLQRPAGAKRRSARAGQGSAATGQRSRTRH